MKNHKTNGIFLIFLFFSFNSLVAYAQKAKDRQVDVCVYGGTSAGVIAAYTAKKMGKTILLIEPGGHLGGLSSGGLGFTDIGNKYVVTGLAQDFYRRIGTHYGQLEQWIFEPHVAENTFQSYISQANVSVLYHYRLLNVIKKGNLIKSIMVESSGDAVSTRLISAKVFIDCSYEGDLMAKAGVSYTIGRESNATYNETYNGVQLLDGHQFPGHIDPYRVKGDSASGLIWGISSNKLMPQGTGDKKVQAYNYRICLTNNTGNRIPISRPSGYDSTHYELLARLIETQKDKLNLNDYFIWSAMPGQKTDINNRNGFSTDMIGANYLYPDGNYQVRSQYINDLKLYSQGLLYFFGHDERVPLPLRKQMLQWGYPKDEFKDNNNWSFQPYIREARRMIGSYVMTQANCSGKIRVTDSIAMAAYTMDSHNCDRLVINQMVKNEGNVEIPGFPPYPLSYRALLPKQRECSNLLVPVCLSASHIAYGSIRMEPIFMVLGQVAGVAAGIAVDEKKAVQNINYQKINKIIKNNPLLNGRKVEQVIDNQSKGIVVKGNWVIKQGNAYGPDMLCLDSHGKSAAAVRFYPKKSTHGTFKLYSYYPALQAGADTTCIKIFDGLNTHLQTLIKSNIKVEGQTSGEWVFLGTFALSTKSQPYVEIGNNGSTGIIAADAVLFKPDKL